MLRALVLVAALTAPMILAPGVQAQPLRAMRYTSRTPAEAGAKVWQGIVRDKLFTLLHMTDHASARGGPAMRLDPKVLKTEEKEGYALEELQLRSTEERLFKAMLARPKVGKGKMPAVVCIHGHGGNRMTPFDPDALEYKLFGDALARRGFVVISTDVGQHEVHESGRTLMGERLWDVMRCVDYLETLPEVDARRIGCAGLSLGGEMAMWLGAMDTRIAVVVSAGFLTFMDHMEQNHCMCWKFDGLRGLVDFPDIYALIAPRPLQCQNGLKEPETQFYVPLARKALKELEVIYRDLGAPDRVELHVHPGGHEIDLDPMVAFLSKYLEPCTK